LFLLFLFVWVTQLLLFQSAAVRANQGQRRLRQDWCVWQDASGGYHAGPADLPAQGELAAVLTGGPLVLGCASTLATSAAVELLFSGAAVTASLDAYSPCRQLHDCTNTHIRVCRFACCICMGLLAVLLLCMGLLAVLLLCMVLLAMLLLCMGLLAVCTLANGQLC
jgi:hypothetical protein